MRALRKILYPRLHDTTGCQSGCHLTTGCQPGLTTALTTVLVSDIAIFVLKRELTDNRVERTATVRSTVLNEQPLFIQAVVKPRCTTSLTTSSGCIV